MSHRMILNQTAYLGRGAIDNIADEVTGRGFTKVLVVTDKGLVSAGIVDRVLAVLDRAQLDYEIYDDVTPNPTIAAVQGGVAAFQEARAEAIIAVGGGSPVDTAKAIGIIIANPEFADVRSLEGVAPTKYPAAPIIAVATTAGTAAEVTINYVITDVENKRKFVCVDPHDIPVVAVVDPDLMDAMPVALRVATGMDALTHAIEGYTTAGAWALTDVLHLAAIEMIAKALPEAARGEAAGVEQMALAQYVAGMGFSNVGLGIVHAMAHPLGAFYDTPHGIANAVLLPTVMAFNAEYTGEKYRRIAAAFGVRDAADIPLARAREAAVGAVRELVRLLEVPPRLRDIGVREEDIPALADAAFADVCAGGNPRPASRDQLEELYRSIY